MGAPDLCIAAWIPMVTTACAIVREALLLNFVLISWIHGEIGVYQQKGWGGLADLMFADAHFCIYERIQKDILQRDEGAKTFLIGNPVKLAECTEYSPDERTLCFVGRIVLEKRLDMILNQIALANEKIES